MKVLDSPKGVGTEIHKCRSRAKRSRVIMLGHVGPGVSAI